MNQYTSGGSAFADSLCSDEVYWGSAPHMVSWSVVSCPAHSQCPRMPPHTVPGMECPHAQTARWRFLPRTWPKGDGERGSWRTFSPARRGVYTTVNAVAFTVVNTPLLFYARTPATTPYNPVPLGPPPARNLQHAPCPTLRHSIPGTAPRFGILGH